MKKILIIMVMLMGVGVSAQSSDLLNTGAFNQGNTGSFNQGDTGSFNQGNTGSFNQGNTGAFNQGNTGSFNQGNTGSNIMLGGTGSNSAVGGGLGQGSNSELNRTPSYNPSGSGVPKLSLEGVVMWLVGIMNQLVYVILGAALVMFLYGILKLSFIDGEKAEARAQARKFMVWGIVSLFVMVSVWGLVRILQFSLFGSGNLILPQLK
jgi:hypothetical protein